MNNRTIASRSTVAFAGLALAGLSVFGAFGAAQGQVETNPRPLVVALDDNYPPYVFVGADGNLKGILPDQWALWEKKTGTKVVLQAMEWGKAQQFMREGKADVLDTVFLTPERAQLYDFTPPYARIQVPIYAHKTLTGIGDVDSLKGFTVGVKAGDAVIGHLASHGIDTLQEYPSYEAIIQAAKKQEIKVFSVDQPAAVFFMYKNGIANEFNESMVLYTGEFHRAVRKNRADLLNRVQSGFGRISPREYRAIERKWMGSPFLLREIARQWGLYLLLILVVILALAVLNAILSFRVRAKTADLLASREYFASVFDSINDALFIHDAGTGRILDVNRRMLEMYGFSSREEVLATGPGIVSAGAPPYSQEDALRWMGKARDEGPQIFEWRAKHHDGHLFWVEVSVRRVQIGPDSRLIVSVRDISDRKTAEEERRTCERRMLEAQKLESLGLLAGGIAHDFNNLLAAIMGNLDLALMALPKESPVRDDILAIGVSTKRAAELIQQMLAFSGQSRFVIESVDVEAMLHRSMQMIRSTMPPHAAVQLNVPLALPAIEADEGQVRQVIMNLVANAVDSMENRTGTVELSAGVMDSHQLPALPLWPHATLPPGTYVYIDVKDDGAGIPTDQLGKIFEPFYSTKFTGRGLGLPAVLGIVRGHKGAIQVKTALGKGSTFRVLFPAKT